MSIDFLCKSENLQCLFGSLVASFNVLHFLEAYLGER